MLLDHRRIPKITDFGVGQIIDIKGYTTLTNMNARFAPPERLPLDPEQPASRPTKEGDIWSLGILFLQASTIESTLCSQKSPLTPFTIETISSSTVRANACRINISQNPKYRRAYTEVIDRDEVIIINGYIPCTGVLWRTAGRKILITALPSGTFYLECESGFCKVNNLRSSRRMNFTLHDLHLETCGPIWTNHCT